jgi:hypothetical protein
MEISSKFTAIFVYSPADKQEYNLQNMILLRNPEPLISYLKLIRSVRSLVCGTPTLSPVSPFGKPATVQATHHEVLPTSYL